jgi:hypothetical protein
MFNGYLGFVTFDPTGSTQTNPTDINSAGQIVGTYVSDGTEDGFIYSAGTITTLAVYGALDTGIVGINSADQMIGTSATADSSAPSGFEGNGFLDTAGSITVLALADGTALGPASINSTGQITGTFATPTEFGVDEHGFLDTAGAITTFDVPGASNAIPVSINDAGQITGYYFTGSDNVTYGFLDTAGTFTTLDLTGAYQMDPKSINSSGQITGAYADADGNYHGFIYSAGTFTTIDVPGSEHTIPESINDAGDVVGYYQIGTGAPHGFIDVAGMITTFDVPGSISTSPDSTNSADQITGTYQDSTGQQHGFIAAPCFCAGTRIATERCAMRVDDLRPGDRVLSAFGGSVPVVWIGHRRVGCRRHPRPHEVWPVRVRAGAFADDMPAHDVLLSPDHAVYVDEVLIPVRCLVNGFTIVQEPVDEVSYFHVELPSHDVILAEGLPAESYLDTGNRGAFENGGSVRQLHPDFAQDVWQAEACAAQITHGPIHAAVVERLRARATAVVQEPRPIAFPSSIACALKPHRA